MAGLAAPATALHPAGIRHESLGVGCCRWMDVSEPNFECKKLASVPFMFL